MAASSNILREYLVSLGFKVDEAGGKKVNTQMASLDKTAMALGKSVVAVGTAVAGMVAVFTYQMEKLYYASKRTDSAVGSIQAMEFAGKQIGVSADAMRGSLEGMARALRSNPGLTGLLNSLGVRVTGRDKADVMADLVEQLSKMPFATAKSIASLFGMDEDTLFMLIQGKDKMKEMMAMRKQLANDAGLDLDAAAKASMEWNNQLSQTYERLGIIKDRISYDIIKAISGWSGAMNENLDVLIKYMGKFKSLGEMWDSLTTGKNQAAPEPKGKRTFMGWLFSSPMAAASSGAAAGAQPAQPAPLPGAAAGATQAGGAGAMSPAERMRALEAKYGLPDGLLDRVWKQESNRGDPKFMRSKAGAKGHFQFMDKTAAAYGVQDPDNFEQSSEGSAKMWADLLKQYNGDVRKAAAAYNYGSGNMAKLPLGAPLPAETQKYQDAIAGPAVQQTNHITVTGVSDPKQAAHEILKAQQISNADLQRQFQGRSR
jgi:hypothetical protein